LRRALDWFLNYRPDLAALVSRGTTWNRRAAAAVAAARQPDEKLLRRMLDETEFLSTTACARSHGTIASIAYTAGMETVTVSPSTTTGRVDVRPVRRNRTGAARGWMPVNYLIIESLQSSITTTATTSS